MIERRNLVTVELKRRSICPCGFGVLKDEIQIGVRYRIDMNSRRRGFTYVCGGCSRVHENVEVVDATQLLNPCWFLAPLPYGLFSTECPVAPALQEGAR
jgi:hypothetical protein